MRQMDPKLLADVAGKLDKAQRDRAQASGIYQTADKLFRSLASNTAQAIAITLSLSSRYAIEGGATKEAWLKDCDKAWDTQEKFVAQLKEQNEAQQKAIEAAMAANGENPVGEVRVIQVPLQPKDGEVREPQSVSEAEALAVASEAPPAEAVNGAAGTEEPAAPPSDAS